MAKEVVMPKLGLTMTEGTIENWLKAEGDAVKEGEVLFSVSTDKLTNDVEAMASGKLLKILVPAGETVACLTPVAVIGAPPPPPPRPRPRRRKSPPRAAECWSSAAGRAATSRQ